jgi:hypothetical protein
MLPSVLGIIRYQFDPGNGAFMAVLLLGYNVAFVAGYRLANTRRRGPGAPGWDAASHVPSAMERRVLHVATLCAVVGTGLSIIDYLFFRRIVLDDLTLAREMYVGRQANMLEQIGALLMWGPLYTLAYVVVYLPRLSWLRKALYIAPVVGFFSLGLLSAGRQAAFQILIVMLVALAFRKEIVRERRKMSLAWRVALAAVASGMIGYMGFVAHARHDGNISDSKAAVLQTLFHFDLDPTVDAITDQAGPEVKDSTVEALVYLNSPVNMLSVFVSEDAPRHYFGMMTFPLVARRFEWLYGKSVVTAMAEHADRMTRGGVIGVGWFTTYAAFILDFGYTGCGILMFIIGMLSRHAWAIYQRERSFLAFILLVCVYVTIVCVPLFSAISDTNMFLLTVVSVVGWRRSARRRHGRSRLGTMAAKRPMLPSSGVPVQ